MIKQVKGEFRVHGYCINLHKNTVNWYVANEKIGTFPLTWGNEGTMLQHAFNLLVIEVESFIQINQVNNVVVLTAAVTDDSQHVLRCHIVGMQNKAQRV